jgi:hypothetical protein
MPAIVTNNENALDAAPSSKLSLKEVSNVISTYTKIGTTCHGGLIYRGSRSQQYVAELHRLISDTRSIPIEGWQSYDQFLRRNVEHEYANIDAIVNRYIAVGSRVDRLVSVYQIERQMDFSKKITVFPALLLTSSIVTLLFVLTNNIPDVSTIPWASYARRIPIILGVLCLAYLGNSFVLKEGHLRLWERLHDRYQQWNSNLQERLYLRNGSSILKLSARRAHIRIRRFFRGVRRLRARSTPPFINRALQNRFPKRNTK